MMRSLYSAVSGLKTHQTRMDVIGNNISNVNTEAFKASQVTFSEIMYQTTSKASGGDVQQGIGGVNAKQIGLGVSFASTMVTVETSGAAETTGNPFDLRLSDSQTTNFFIVSDGTNTKFTRAGSFYVDGNGFLCMTSTGYTLMGWQVDQTTGDIRKDTVSALQVMSTANMTSEPEGTTRAYVSGVLDKNDTDLKSGEEAGKGYIMQVGFFDKLGYAYTGKFSVHPAVDGDGNEIEGQYTVRLESILDSSGKAVEYQKPDGTTVTLLRSDENTPEAAASNGLLNSLFGYDDETNTGNDATINVFYDTNKGTFTQIQYGAGKIDQTNPGTYTGQTSQNIVANANGEVNFDAIKLNLSKLVTTNQGANNTESNFEDITIDFSLSMNYNNGGVSSMKMLKGQSTTDEGAGKKLGKLTGLTVENSGRVYGSYDNGNTVLLCQIPVAQFANASGLEKVGENCYVTTLNSGEFDGIGVEITNDGSKMSTGELEMSNVDLAGEFTGMIVTQRGFQANSRVITTSDTLLEELINLKR